MEIITAIALLCQISFGLGDGNRYMSTDRNFKKATNLIETKQKSCQKELATCLFNANNYDRNLALKCIKDRT